MGVDATDVSHREARIPLSQALRSTDNRLAASLV